MYMSIFLHICIYTDLSVFLHICAYSCKSCAKVKSAASLQVAAPFNCLTVHNCKHQHLSIVGITFSPAQLGEITIQKLNISLLAARASELSYGVQAKCQRQQIVQNIPCHVFIVKHHPAFQLSHNWAVAKHSDFTHFQTFSAPRWVLVWKSTVCIVNIVRGTKHRFQGGFH